ncbi:GNAT family N-acetyltransferase [Paenibacillus sp. UNC451MF]|uniref:GNAT family N-acetyltransferase n=1 Tax=Paenibacillus sp. UNC451MF TaxID=1449063 RepID=UPI00055ADDF2|nr:GNAT family N-acetyltransferase [Paenibacillus sp. UNC451MF]
MKSFVIRHIPKEHFQDSLSLSEFAFQYEVPKEEREKKISLLKEKECWGAYVDGKLAARMTVMDLHTWLYGKRFAMGGIASVATWPEYRRGGLVSGLLSNALQVMREQGQTLSYLHPFQFAFYRKFGWETYTETKQYEIPTSLLPKLPHQPGRIVRVGRDIELLNSIYQQYATGYNGTLDRDDAWWNNRIFNAKKGTAAVYYDASGSPSGYVHYEVKNQVCRIHELVYLHQEAWKGLWRFIADHDSMIEKVTISVPADDRMSYLLDNPRIKQETIPYFMARIVDVKPFLEQFPFAATREGLEGSLRLRVTDAHAEWNDGEFLLEISPDGHVHVEKMTEGESSAPVIACGIGTLTAMLMGYQRPTFLHEIERLQGDQESVRLLESIIPKAQTYLPDFF